MAHVYSFVLSFICASEIWDLFKIVTFYTMDALAGSAIFIFFTFLYFLSSNHFYSESFNRSQTVTSHLSGSLGHFAGEVIALGDELSVNATIIERLTISGWSLFHHLPQKINPRPFLFTSIINTMEVLIVSDEQGFWKFENSQWTNFPRNCFTKTVIGMQLAANIYISGLTSSNQFMIRAFNITTFEVSEETTLNLTHSDSEFPFPLNFTDDLEDIGFGIS